MDVMIQKKEGLIQVDSLHTIILFQPDCNYAFKYLGREMMRIAKKHKILAAEQFGVGRDIGQSTKPPIRF